MKNNDGDDPLPPFSSNRKAPQWEPTSFVDVVTHLRIADVLSCIRALLGSVLLFLLSMLGSKARTTSIAIILLALLLDYLDGWIARDAGTRLGAIIDLTSDKIFIYPALFFLGIHEREIFYCAVVLLNRDFVMMALRLFLTSNRSQVQPDKVSKFKTVLTYVALIIVQLSTKPAEWLLCIAALLSLVSLANFIRENKRQIFLGLINHNTDSATDWQPR